MLHRRLAVSPTSYSIGHERQKDNPVKTYKFKMYSNHTNRELQQTIDSHAEVWNHFVALCRRYYAIYGTYPGKKALMRHLTKETLNLKGMKSLWGRKVSDLGFSDFVQKLKYIASKKSTEIRFIDKWYPSSKTCHVCGAINQALNLRDRIWQCPNCHTELDRDRNAALNIHRVGASTRSGEVVRPDSSG